MRHTADTPPDKMRLIVPDAARALGISPEAIRNRLSRGTLQSERHGGTVHVLIDRDMVRHADDTPPDTPGDRDALVAELRARIDSLERQLDQERQDQRCPGDAPSLQYRYVGEEHRRHP